MSLREVNVPDIGGAAAVDVTEVLIKVGQIVAEGDPLISLESDKASMEVPSPVAGKVVSVLVKVGDQVGEGSAIASIEASAAEPSKAEPKAEAEPETKADAVPAKPKAEGQPLQVGTPDQVPTQPRNSPDDPLVHERSALPKKGEKPAHASPSIRKFARELGVDLKLVPASGRKARITKEDVQQFVKGALAAPKPTTGQGSALPEMPVIDFAKFGEIEVRPLSRIQKLSAASLHRSWLHVPHVTQFDDADITEMEAFRKSQKEESSALGINLTPIVFIMKAVVAAMKTYPKFCSSLDPSGESLILKHYFHLGVAVDTPNGLVVPVIRDVDQKSLYTLSAELKEVSGRARDGKLKTADIQGACFTISSLGGIGGTAFTPIVNAPEVAILGVSRSSIKPVWDGKQFEPRLILPLSLSYDHRVIDGADAARFTTYLCKVLGDIRHLLL